MPGEEMNVNTDNGGSCPRTTEDVFETLALASIEKAELINVSQILGGKKNHDNKYKLLELDKHLESSILEGHILEFKGQENEPLILCSNNKTYEVKEAETSNSLILLPEVKLFKDLKKYSSEDWRLEKAESEGVFHTYFEVRECKPKLGTLLSLLTPSSFNGTENEQAIDPSTLVDWEKLVCSIQASDEEIEKALSRYMVVKMDGYYRLISLNFETQLLLFMANFMDSNSWETDEIDKGETYEALQDLVPLSVFNLVFKKYTKISGKNGKIKTRDDEPLYEYDQESVCRVFAQAILIASPTTEYSDFMEAWNSAAPASMTPKVEYLRGIALIRTNLKTGRKEVISYPETNLSENIIARLQELFGVQEKWTLEEITPYIEPLATDSMNVVALLTKYARPSTMNKVRCYSSKHGKKGG